jgi:hypothetical protein
VRFILLINFWVKHQGNMEHYKNICDFLDDDEAILQYAQTLSQTELVGLLKYLTASKRVRDDSARAFNARKAEELGHTIQWHRVKNDPEAYQRKLEYNRVYRQKKRKNDRGAATH